MLGGAKLLEAGDVEGPTAQSKYLVRLTAVPRIGDILCDPSGRRVAVVRDIIGNVKRPIAVVEPVSKGVMLKKSSRVFILKERRRG